MAEVIVERVRAKDWHGAAGRIPANDDVRGTITPDDTRFFVALGLVCVGVLILAAYVVMSGPDELMTVAMRR